MKTNLTEYPRVDPKRLGPSMVLVSGRRAYPVFPKVSDIHVEDIAHALSMLCRYGGHVPQFYSVAQHACLVHDLVPPELRAAALHHDDNEALQGDMISPLKYSSVGVGYRSAEERCQRVIFKALRIPWRLMSEIKKYDDLAYRLEERYVRGYKVDIPLDSRGLVQGFPVSFLIASGLFDSWEPERAREQFLKRHKRLNA